MAYGDYGQDYETWRADPYGNLNRQYPTMSGGIGGDTDQYAELLKRLQKLLQGGGFGGGQGGGIGDALQQGGGAAMMANPIVGAGMMAGGTLLKGLGLSGQPQSSKYAKQMYGQLGSMEGQKILRPMEYANQAYSSIGRHMQPQAERIGQRLNLDSGAAQGEILRLLAQGNQDWLLNALPQADVANANYNLDIKRLKAALLGYIQ